MDSKSSFRAVKKLGSDNFDEWEPSFTYAVILAGLQDSVGPDAVVGEHAPSAERQNLLAWAALGSCVEPIHQHVITEARDKARAMDPKGNPAQLAWQALKDKFLGNIAATRLTLQSQLMQLAKDPSESITEYVGRGRKLWARLGQLAPWRFSLRRAC